MARGLRIVRAVAPGPGRQQIGAAQLADRLAHADVGSRRVVMDDVEFGPIARRDDQRFGAPAVGSQRPKRREPFVAREGQRLTPIDARGAMVHANQQEVHVPSIQAFLAWTTTRRPATDVFARAGVARAGTGPTRTVAPGTKWFTLLDIAIRDQRRR